MTPTNRPPDPFPFDPQKAAAAMAAAPIGFHPADDPARLGPPDYSGALRSMAELRKHTTAVLAADEKRLQLAQRATKLQSGEYLRGLRDEYAQKQKTAQLEERERRAELAFRRQTVGSAGFAASALSAARVRIEEEKLRRTVAEVERKADLQARYGATIGGLAHAAGSPAARIAGGLALGAAGTTVALARSGFSGTVEGNRLSLESEMLARELAGSFKPAVEGSTRAMKWFRQSVLEQMSPAGQNALAIGAGGVAALGAAHFASRRLLGMGLIEAAGSGLGALAGAFGGRAAAGAAAGAAAAAGTGAAAKAAAAGAAGTAAGAAGGGVVAGGAGVLAPLASFAGAGAIAGYQAEDALGNFGRRHRTFAGQIRNTGELMASSNPFTALGAGSLKLADRATTSSLRGLVGGDPAADAILGKEGGMLFGGGDKGPVGRQVAKLFGSDGRRTVTPGDSSFGEIGSSYDRMTLATAAVYQDPSGKPMTREGEPGASWNGDMLSRLEVILSKIEENTAPDRAVPKKNE